MMLGHYVGKKKLEAQFPLVSSLTGDSSSWDLKEKEMMAIVLPKCKSQNESGNVEQMKSCWIAHAAAIPDGGNSSRTLSDLLDKQLKTKE